MAPELWRQQSDSVIASAVARFLPGPGKAALKTDLYDETVSDGVIGELAGRFTRISAIDSDPEVVGAAHARHPAVDARVADVRRLPFADESFDAILSNSTLDHFESADPVRDSLVELRRVLRPEGRLLVTLDNPINPLIAVRNALPERAADRLRGGFGYRAGWTCGPRRLRALLGEAGFEVAERTALLHGPRFLAARAGAATEGADRRLERLLAFERLERLPTRYLTGHFVAALAVPKQ